ncbi:hypothetical protein PTSG_06481 [Salpingoeca rosetta]|uniref:Uncharacterized protein n=1 Tax=Salpingoeca rosetta (strain ATCC 50818 / BSB-021) TaxID=946362 RepID=F2UFX8_SALR5|nr:uncharacterized protein PTSG_06481 [Salpingoeca rosetta]EGD75406.1 hypothetical protein PTSG_06481 [Salpingoeca rosetta]|eukprot:XP_004991863.1 hypothetical protein PTSG_06481 [Salpingoeca rosetta]
MARPHEVAKATMAASAVLAAQASPALDAAVAATVPFVKGAIQGAANFAVAHPVIAGAVVGGAVLYAVYKNFDEIKAAAGRLCESIQEGWFEMTARPEDRLRRANEQLQELQVSYGTLCARVCTEVQVHKALETQETREAVQEAVRKRKEARQALDKLSDKVVTLMKSCAK